MDYKLTVTLTVLGGILLGLFQEKVGAEFVMLTALLVLVFAGIVTVPEALAGFADPAVVTIAALFVVGSGLQATGALDYLSAFLLGRPRPGTRLVRLLAPITGLSAFMNNTPLVAFMLPIFVHVAKKLRVSPSKLLIPLSYAAVLGGACTLIGTSTNLVVDGLLRKQNLPGMTMFELSWIGVPIAVLGLLYLSTFGQRLLPDRVDLLERVEANPREYTVEMIVDADCPLIGKTVRQSGLRDLPGLYLYRIERMGHVITPVTPEEKLRGGDLLFFSGIVSTVVDLQKIRGLHPVEHRDGGSFAEGVVGAALQPNSLDSYEGVPTEFPQPAPRQGRQLCEVVLSSSSPLVGRSVKDADFRSRYNASIIAVHRHTEKLEQKIGKTVLQVGDTLLIDADADFHTRWRNSPDFVLVSGVEDSAPVAHEKTWFALAVVGLVVVGMTVSTGYIAPIALAGAVIMIAGGCMRGPAAHASIEMPVLLLVGSALGVSKALDTSGAADWLARSLLAAVQPYGSLAVLTVIVVLTGVLTELLSNNATAALMGTLAVAIAHEMGVEPRPLLLAVCVTASYGFATPIGYQTNLMVLNAGGYRFADYFRVGIPLDLLAWTMTIVLISVLW